MVIRTMIGAGLRAAAQHSQCLYSIFTHIPGLKVVVPSNPYEAKGLLVQAIRDDDPVIFFEHKAMYDVTAEVPDDPYTIPFGESNVTREGDDVTIITMGRMVNFSNQVADKLAKEKIGVTVVDLRTTSPLDTETVLETASETGRVVVVDEADPRCNMAADISALICQEAFDDLKAPIKIVTAPHCPVPFRRAWRTCIVPSPQDRGGGPRVMGKPDGRRDPSHRHAEMGPGDGGGGPSRPEHRGGGRHRQGPEIADIETSKIANVSRARSPVQARRVIATARRPAGGGAAAPRGRRQVGDGET